MIQRTIALFKKDMLLEWRQLHTFYGILLYVAATIFVIYLAMDGSPNANTWNSLFWVIQLFVCVNTVAKSFLQEGRGRMLYFYSITAPEEFILAKLLFNALLTLIMNIVSLGLFFLFLENPVSDSFKFLAISMIGGISLSLVFTVMSAIASKAQHNAALIAILGFPVILPNLLLIIRLSKTAFAEIFDAGAVWQLTGLVLMMDVLVIVLSIILFPFLWKD